jgi:hypothetical protein
MKERNRSRVSSTLLAISFSITVPVLFAITCLPRVYETVGVPTRLALDGIVGGEYCGTVNFNGSNYSPVFECYHDAEYEVGADCDKTRCIKNVFQTFDCCNLLPGTGDECLKQYFDSEVSTALVATQYVYDDPEGSNICAPYVPTVQYVSIYHCCVGCDPNPCTIDWSLEIACKNYLNADCSVGRRHLATAFKYGAPEGC